MHRFENFKCRYIAVTSSSHANWSTACTGKSNRNSRFLQKLNLNFTKNITINITVEKYSELDKLIRMIITSELLRVLNTNTQNKSIKPIKYFIVFENSICIRIELNTP